ncbi:MAG: Ig-like domain-containing protein, partial [Planctomycetota bacterium]|nr:Ig-like domain-containing protein [Planctomycetota bacterium]
MTLNVTGDQAPTAQAFSVDVPEGQRTYVTGWGMTDPENDVLSSVTLTSLPSHGSLWLGGSSLGLGLIRAGDLQYVELVADPNWHGTDGFDYKVTDSYPGTSVNSAHVTVNVTGNNAPVAIDDNKSTPEDVPLTVAAWDGVLSNDTDLESDSLTALLVAGPAHGTLDLHADGSFTYTPASNFNGTDSFTYKAHDGAADSEITTVNLWVTSVNDAPVARDGSFTTAEDTAILMPRGGYDVDEDTLTSTVVTPPAHGWLSGDSSGVTYHPQADWHGTDSFTYKVNDGQVDSNIGTVSITVTPVNDAPVAGNFSASGTEDISVPLSGWN